MICHEEMETVTGKQCVCTQSHNECLIEWYKKRKVNSRGIENTQCEICHEDILIEIEPELTVINIDGVELQTIPPARVVQADSCGCIQILIFGSIFIYVGISFYSTFFEQH